MNTKKLIEREFNIDIDGYLHRESYDLSNTQQNFMFFIDNSYYTMKQKILMYFLGDNINLQRISEEIYNETKERIGDLSKIKLPSKYKKRFIYVVISVFLIYHSYKNKFRPIKEDKNFYSQVISFIDKYSKFYKEIGVLRNLLQEYGDELPGFSIFMAFELKNMTLRKRNKKSKWSKWKDWILKLATKMGFPLK